MCVFLPVCDEHELRHQSKRLTHTHTHTHRSIKAWLKWACKWGSGAETLQQYWDERNTADTRAEPERDARACVRVCVCVCVWQYHISMCDNSWFLSRYKIWHHHDIYISRYKSINITGLTTFFLITKRSEH